jgi:uncharacterized protein with HEPN domain
MPHNAEKFLRDMLDRAKLIQDYTAGKSRDEFLKAGSLQDAVRWNLCVIGEALSQMRRVDEAKAEQLTGYTKIIGLRNQLIHGYTAIKSIVTTEFKRFVAGVIRLPCRVVRNGRRIICRLLSCGLWHGPLLSAVAAWRTSSLC